MVNVAHGLKRKVEAFRLEANELFARHEGSKYRTISVDNTRQRIQGLSLQQHELFVEALACVEQSVYRAAHVIAWAAFMDFLERKLASDGLAKLRVARTTWGQYKTIDEIRENVPEYQIIEAARDVGLLSKSETKTILGLLAKRNECAHPSEYRPGLNESLGFISELLNRIERLGAKSL
ncbi:MAG: hypothetical protein HY671_05405 [Chloroflexi bacterium]|nr:hypothetical protein [Chloroflexota bacterium]